METTDLLDQNLYVRVFRACETVILPSSWKFRYSDDAFWRLYRNEEEGAIVTTKNESIPIHPGRLYIIPAHLYIELACNHPIPHFYAHFDIMGLPDIALRGLFNAPFWQSYGEHVEYALQAIKPELAPEWPNLGQPLSAIAQCWIKSLIYETLARYLQSLPTERIEHFWLHTERMKPVLPAVTFIESHLSASLSTPLLAELCSMSEGYFIRTFRACMGQTPTQYITECRIKSAMRYLLLTSDSIDRIAEVCGFGSRDYFSRIFARQTGRPPAAFRRAQYGDVEKRHWEHQYKGKQVQ